jgi:hypothetical protein
MFLFFCGHFIKCADQHRQTGIAAEKIKTHMKKSPEKRIPYLTAFAFF